MRQVAAKLSISVPGDLAAEVRRRVGARGLSAFVARAIAHELEREQLGALLDELGGAVRSAGFKLMEQAESPDELWQDLRNFLVCKTVFSERSSRF